MGCKWKEIYSQCIYMYQSFRAQDIFTYRYEFEDVRAEINHA